MTQSDQSGTRCPRRGQPITFRKDHVTIYPHHDNVTREPCPMGGVGYDEARDRVAEARARIREMAG